MMNNSNTWSKYGARLLFLGPGILAFYTGQGGNPVTVPDRGVVVGGGVRESVLAGGVRDAILGNGLRQSVIGRGVPSAG